MATFKQFLNELMVDIDPSADPNSTIQDVRKQQMTAQRSPQTVAKQQADAAAQNRQTVDANKTEPPQIHTLKTQIARVKEQLMRLQQQLVRAQVSAGGQAPNSPQPGNNSNSGLA